MNTMATARTTTRRTALTGLGALGVMTTAGACSLLPGEDETPAGGADPTTSDAVSDGGGATTEPAPEPGTTFDEWAAREDLRTVEIDLAAADERTGLEPGELERKDRFGAWASPGFPEDSPVLAAEPLALDPEAAEALGGDAVARDALRGVLVQAIIEIADSPLLLESDNSRFEEVAPPLMEALGLDAFDPAAFAPMFEEVPLSGTPVPGEGLPEVYDFEPAPYPEGGPRMSVLETSSLLSRMPAGAPFSAAGAAMIASVRGAVPIVREGEEAVLRREVSFLLGIEDGGMNALMSYVISTGPALAIADAEELPLIEPTEVPEDWQELTLGRLVAAVPSGLGQAEEVELSASVRDESGSTVAAITLYRLPVASPYQLGPAHHAARAEVDGADLVTAELTAGGEAGLILTVRVHVGEEEYHVQLNGLSEEEAPVIAHQVLAGLRVEG